MLHCPKCKVDVAGDKVCCPLCQGELTGTPSCQDPYQFIRPEKFSRDMMFRIVSFASVAAIILTLALNFMVPTDSWWWLFAVAGIASVWVTLSIGITYRKRLFKNITFQLFFTTAASVLWDTAMGWQGWSIDYVLPCACVAYMFSIFVLSKVIRGPQNSYIIYLVLDAVYGIVPLIFIFTGILNTVYPSAICVACSLISIFGLLIFDGRSLKEEITKKMHI